MLEVSAENELDNQALVLKSLPKIEKLVWRLVHRFNLSEDWFDDCYAAAVMALLKVAKGYDSSRNISFYSFFYQRVRGAIIDHINQTISPLGKRTKNWATGIFFNIPEKTFHIEMNEDGEDIVYLDDATPEDLTMTKELNLLMREAYKKLSNEEKDIIYRHYVLQEKITSIANDLDISVGWASRLHSHALNRLRGIYQEMYGAPLS